MRGEKAVKKLDVAKVKGVDKRKHNVQVWARQYLIKKCLKFAGPQG